MGTDDLLRTYILASSRPWGSAALGVLEARVPANWVYVTHPSHLESRLVETYSPDYLFFIHWSWIVPQDLTDKYECVCFHMTDVPYGRGGSPLQNLILRGHDTTRLTALRMTTELDAGPVYMKADLSLHGCAEEVYLRASMMAADMVATIISDRPVPTEQVGIAEYFARRQPTASEIPSDASLSVAYDYIRMLDATGYPHAFLQRGALKIEFRQAVRYHDRVEAHVVITEDSHRSPRHRKGNDGAV